MLRFMLSTIFTALLLPLYLTWSRNETELQIDKMQEAAFNTPGAEAPLPARVVAGGVLLVIGHVATARLLLGIGMWKTLLSLILGSIAGVGLFLLRQEP